MNIKKSALIVFVTLAITIIFAGCSTAEESATRQLSDATQSVEAKVEQLRGEIDDVRFWNSLDRSTDMISTSIQAERGASVGFRFRTSNNETLLLEDAYMFNLPDDSEDWRTLTADQIEYIVATSNPISTAVNSDQSIEITGVIMEWIEYFGADATPRTISVCDINADGKWDFADEGKMFFTNLPNESIPETKNEYGAIGVTKVRDSTTVHLADNIRMYEIAQAVVND